jgi:hypothetical protein
MGTFGALVAVTALPAFASVTSAAYTIGSPSGTVSNVAISPTTATTGVSQSYQVSFTATAALAESATAADDGTITITPNADWAGPPTNVEVIDSASGCFQNGITGTGATVSNSDGATAATSLTDAGITIALADSCPTIASGQTVDVDFNVITSSNFYVTVGTSVNSTSGDSGTVTVSSVPPAVAENSQTFGYPATYTFTSVGAAGAACAAGGTTCTWSGVSANVAAIMITSKGTPLADAVAWDTSGAFTVSYTSGSTTTSDTVTAVVSTTTEANDTVTLELGTSVAAGDTFTVTAQGTNPAAASSDLFDIEPLKSFGPNVGDNNTASVVIPTEVTGAVSYGTSVLSPTVAASPSVAGASSTYTVSFKAQSAAAGTGYIGLEESAGPTSFNTVTGILVKDTTANWFFVPNAVTTTATPGTPTVSGNTPEAAPSTAGGADDILAIPLDGDAITAGDSLTISLVGVTNPASNQTVSDFDIWTSGDSVSAPAADFTIGASGAALPVVTPANDAVSATTNYTITNLYAASGLAGSATADLTLTAEAGTVLPDAPGFYTFTDNTTAAGSGTASLLPAYTPTAVTLQVPNADIVSGDLLTVSIADVVNPSTPGSYTMSFGSTVTGPSVIAPFPQAAATYPNGSIVDFSGTDYLFAGGHAFGIATPTLLAKLQSVDHAAVVKAAAGAILPTSAAREGTLITTSTVNGSATIYVVGTDGQLHGFVTAGSFLGDGYDPALTVTVPNLGGLTTGSTASVEGTAVTALATSADGAIVDSTGTYYVFDGGKAFGIPTPAALTIVRHVDTATPLTGTVGAAQTGAGFASGALLTASGTVYVGYVGDIFPFKSEAQLTADGFGGTASVTVPNLGGLAVVTGYSGS